MQKVTSKIQLKLYFHGCMVTIGYLKKDLEYRILLPLCWQTIRKQINKVDEINFKPNSNVMANCNDREPSTKTHMETRIMDNGMERKYNLSR